MIRIHKYGLMVAWAGAVVAGPAGEWHQLPLRTKTMKEAGFSGGDGFQQTYGFSYAPSDPARVYCTIDCGQVWLSNDGGSNWLWSASGFKANGGMNVAVDPLNKDVAFVAGTQGRYHSPEADGIYRTQDGGTSWEYVFPAAFYKLPARRGGDLFWINPSSLADGQCREIFAAVQDGRGIFRSADGGGSWKNIGIAGLGLVYDFQRCPRTETFWVSTENGLFIIAETAEGEFASQPFPMEQAGLPAGAGCAVSRVQFAAGNPSVVWVLCGKAGVYKSIDGGQTFSPSGRGIPESIRGRKLAVMLDVSPADPDWMILCHHQVLDGNFMSVDGGESWQPFGPMDSSGMIADLVCDKGRASNSFYTAHKTAFHPVDPNVALIPGVHWYLERTDNKGKSWVWSGNGFTGIRVGVSRSSFSFPRARPDEMTLFTTDAGVFRSDDAGSTFRTLCPMVVRIGNALGAKTTPVGAVSPANSNLIICPSGRWNEQKLTRTENGGKTWQIVSESVRNFNFCSFHPQNPEVVYAGDLKSTDAGNTWQQLLYPVADVYARNGDTLYSYVCQGGQASVYRSDDRGESWKQVGPGLLCEGMRELAVSPVDPDRIYAISSNGLHFWNGQSWVVFDESTGLPVDSFGDYALRNIVIDPLHPEVIYLSRLNSRKGYSDGVWRSADGGHSWTNISKTLRPEMAVWAMQADPRHDRLYIGTSQGTWYLDNPSGR